jgi:enamine deaminase RidA (YjgF/YER057c/UK114 family)
MIKKRFFGLVPESGLSLEDQLADSLSRLGRGLYPDGRSGSRILKLTLFLRARNRADFQSRKKALRSLLIEHFGPNLPPTSLIGQPPERGFEVAIEIMALEGIPADVCVSYKEYKDVCYALVNYPEGKEIISAGLTAPDASGETGDLSEISFSRMKGILIREGLDFSHVVRQWNYIEQIVGTVPGTGGRKQNYQQFNDVRSLFYESSPWSAGYPSATGIGMNTGGIIIDFIAASGPSSWLVLPISNPLQTDAHRYSQTVLVGDPLLLEKNKTAPKFERAKLVFSPLGGQVYISGTAAIRGQITVEENDAAGQAQTTLENILALISPDNLKKSGFHRDIIKAAVSYLRVYVKQKEDIPSVKKVCRRFLPETPALYVVSDVCRPELLVEIEGMMDFTV